MNNMLKFFKKGLFYISTVVVALLIMSFINFTDRFQLNPNDVYRVYLDGKLVGNIKDKDELENYINDEQKDLKEKFEVDKVYVPAGVYIKKGTTYEKELLTAKQVHNVIKEEKPFTIKGYKITIKPKKEGQEKRIIYVKNKEMFDNAIKTVLNAFLSQEQIKNFKDGTQPEIKDVGSLIEDIYIDQDISVKKGYISTDEQIFTDEKILTKYLLFGALNDDEYYTVKEGDTIDSIAFENKLAVPEFLIVNPEFTSANNLLSPGQQVKVGLINPTVDVVVESHTVSDQESQYETKTEYDSSLPAGKKEVIQEGQNGINRLTMKVKTVNGDTKTVVPVSAEVITPAVNKIVKIGTKSYNGGTYVVGTGDWAWPTLPTYVISSPFGYRWGKLHEAIDIAGCGEGSPLFAAQAGTVVTAKHGNKGLGNYVVIDHHNGYHTLYGHMRFLNVTQGQTVQKGQQIGGMGHTGFATGTHVHFGVYKNGYPYRGGTPINPLLLYR